MSHAGHGTEAIVNTAAYYSPQSFDGCPGPYADAQQGYTSPAFPILFNNSQLPAHCQQNASWASWDRSEMYTPGVAYTQDLAVAQPMSFVPGAVLSHFPGTYSAITVPQQNSQSKSVFAQVPANPLTPQSPPHNEWPGLPAPAMECQPIPRQTRAETRSRTKSPYTRPDGVRKKNARFDIPGDRNLDNIDYLIQAASDEDTKKELKTHKRLLRNRQAALDSRQRKKQHTERLEEEKKTFTLSMQEMEEEMHNSRLEADHHLREAQEWHQRHIESSQYIETLRLEKEEMLRQHSNECDQMRNTIKLLSDKLQQLERSPTANDCAAARVAPMYTESDSTGFTEFTGEMDGLHVGVHLHGWEDGWTFVNPGGHISPQDVKQVVVRAEKASFKAHSAKKEREEDKVVPLSLLWMLLLCGALVVSKGSLARTSAIPPSLRIPEDVRTASVKVLEALVMDAELVNAVDFEQALAPYQRSSTCQDWLHPTLNPAGVPNVSGFPSREGMLLSTPGFGYQTTLQVGDGTSNGDSLYYIRGLLSSSVPSDLARDLKHLIPRPDRMTTTTN